MQKDIKQLRNRLFLLITGMLCAVMMYGTTAAKGVFTVAAGKTVQFANANSVYSANELIQWEHLEDVTESGWDVLTGAEWSYLLAEGRTNAATLNSLATVNGHYGMVILPDGWVQPEGIPVFSTAYPTHGYGTNVYSTAQWEVMAQSGAVFLPCAGYGYEAGGGTPAEDTEDHGAYWAKNQYSTDNAFCIHFNDDAIHDNNNAVKTNYYSVILVKKVTPTVLDETDELAAFTPKLAAADEYGFAYMNRTLVKDGTLYTLCLPFDVPNVDASPLAGAEVFEFAGGRESGAAGNEVLYLNMRPLSGKRLTQGVPYILRWEKTVPADTIKQLRFYDVENWDDDTNAATDPGNETIKFHGVYPKAHIPGYTSGSSEHYNFFMGANNTLYWPDDATYGAEAKMKGFRAYFYITPGGGPSPVSRYRNMPAVWSICAEPNSPTSTDNVQRDNVQGTKVMRNGQIYLMYNGAMYNVQGQRIEYK